MYFRTSVYGNNIIIETDNEPVIKERLSYQYKTKAYNPRLKRFAEKVVKGHIYNRKLKDSKSGNTYFELGIGWLSYLARFFKDVLIPDDYNTLCSCLLRPTYRTHPFPELRDYQNEDMLHVLKYRRGLISVYTGFGKSQCIAVLAHEMSLQGKRILLVTPSIKARDELVKRIYSLYGIEVALKPDSNSNITAIITNGLMNKKAMKDPAKRAAFESYLETIDVVLADECEYCMNAGGFEILDNCCNAEYCFGFSGTADKSGGKLISIGQGLNVPTVIENKDLIKYFGPSLVYRQPQGLEVKQISVITPSMNSSNLSLWDMDFEGSSNVYLEIMDKIFTNPKVCETIVKIAETFPTLFIPINNLNGIISNWIENYFKGKFRVLLVCHKGYIYYDLQGNETSLTLAEACDRIRQGEVDVIPSTSSGFRALDFPCLKNMLIFSGKIAGSVLQCVGRIARQQHLNIISLEPEDGKPIPVYTKGCNTRSEMIRDYYKFCLNTEVKIKESDLENYEGNV